MIYQNIDFVTTTVLICCVDWEQLKDEGISYLERNKELTRDALFVLERVRARIESKLLINLNTLDNSYLY